MKTIALNTKPGLTLPGYGLADPRTMRRLRHVSIRAEKLGLWRSLGSYTYRGRAIVLSLFPKRVLRITAQAHSDKSGLRQRYERLLLVVLMRMHPDNYYRLCLYEPQRFARSGEFICFRQLRKLLAYTVASVEPQVRETLEDKTSFFRFCLTHSLPTPPVISVWRCDENRFDRGDAATEPLFKQYRQLFFKPIRGICGAGVGTLSAATDNRWNMERNGASDVLSWKQLKAVLATAKEDLIFQPRLRNHSMLSRFGEHALHTVRLVTLRLGSDVYVCAASLKIAGPHSVADNFAVGSVAAQVDITTGRLGSGARKSPSSIPASLVAIPETGERFAGLSLPFWVETVDLARRFHNLVPELPSVGQDIAITDGGPVLIEANPNWDGELLQKASDVGLGRSPLSTVIEAYCGLT